MGDKLLNHNNIIRGSSLGEKNCLDLDYDSIEKRLDPISYNFRDDFVLGVVQPNRSKVFKIDNISAFGD